MITRLPPQLFTKSRDWDTAQTRRDLRFFERQCAIQQQDHL
jgi:hypothetical protein